MNETTMTVIGNLVDAPNLRRTRNGHSVASFRVASTPRRFDREKGTWVDGATLFVTVTAWRALAENVAQSLAKGQSVVVHGRYCQRGWEKDETLRTAYELEATAVGHDLARGVSVFERVVRTATPQFEIDDHGAPLDRTGEYLDEQADTGAVEIDPETGEVRELAPV